MENNLPPVPPVETETAPADTGPVFIFPKEIPNEPLLLPEPRVSRKLIKQLIIICAALVLTLAGGILIVVKTRPAKAPALAPIIIPTTTVPMIIASDAFKNNEHIPGKYTCDGLNINPPLHFADIPAGTISLALIVDDPDAPSGNWTHWVVWNIRPDTASIAENSSPKGAAAGRTDFGTNRYGGPCPPATPKPGEGGSSGTHHYQFKIYALDTTLNLLPDAKEADLINAMQGHIITEAQLTGLYSR